MAQAEPVWAVDPAAWFGADKAPAASAEVPAQALLYKVSISGRGLSDEMKRRVAEVASLVKLQEQGAADIGQLVQRARGDLRLIKAVAYEEGHYGVVGKISIEGRDVTMPAVFDVATDGGRVREVAVSVTPGPAFKLGAVSIHVTRETPVRPPMEPAGYGLETGAVARSGLIVRAIERITEAWRVAGYPFARIAHKAIQADHANATVDVELTVDPGRQATYGWLNVTGAERMSPGMVARYSGLRPGETYSSTDLEKAGERLRKLDAIESVRIDPGQELDAGGGIPVTFHVREKKRRFIGASASASTIDGGEVQAYWGHRNLFGRAERLRVEGSVSRLGSESLDDLQYEAKATLTMPGVLDIDTDLFTEFRAARERPETYETRLIRLETGMVRKFSETRTGRISIVGSVLEEEDAFGTSRHQLLSLPVEYVRDERDSKLDPSEGWRLITGAEPVYDFAGNEAFVVSRAAVSGYRRLGDSDAVVVAVRLGAASIWGAGLEDIPATMRLFAGGSGSVRGYAYRSLGPTFAGEVVGGRGLVEGSVELRWRVNETIGVVAFFDAASVSRDSLPDLSDVYSGAGVGLRYYTSLGPIRLDLAVPLDSGAAFADLAFYVGIGQAF